MIILRINIHYTFGSNPAKGSNISPEPSWFEIGVFDKGGTWLIEGHGVEPDVVIDNLPHATFQGKDAQLTAAVKLLKKKLRDQPITLPPVPPFPKKAAAE